MERERFLKSAGAAALAATLFAGRGAPAEAQSADPDHGILYAGDFGPLNGTAAQTKATLQAWANAFREFSFGIIPPGNYTMAGQVNFPDVSNFVVFAYGARFRQINTTGFCFDLNPNAGTAPTEPGKANCIWWKGGRFAGPNSASSSGIWTNNSAGGLRAVLITRGGIEDVYGEDFGNAFIEVCPVDGWHMRGIHSGMNRDHVRFSDLTDKPGNPQICSVSDFGFGQATRSAIRFDKHVNHIVVDNGYFVSRNAIWASTGGTSAQGSVSSRGLFISRCSFEQWNNPTQDDTQSYIMIRNPNGVMMRALVVENCTFEMDISRILDCQNVNTVTVGNGCNLVSTRANAFTFDAACANVLFGHNSYLAGNPRSIIQAADTSKIKFEATTAW